jgi:hypothetical protein
VVVSGELGELLAKVQALVEALAGHARLLSGLSRECRTPALGYPKAFQSADPRFTVVLDGERGPGSGFG